LAVSKLVRNAAGEPRCPNCMTWSSDRGAEYCLECGTKLIESQNSNSSPVDVSRASEFLTDAELFNESWRASVQKNTARFFEHLNLLPISKPQDREHGYLNDPMLQGNAIQKRAIMILGGESSGKDAKLATIRHKVEQVYDARNVAYQEAKGEAFRDILGAEKWPNKMIQVAGLNDCTDVDFKKDDLRDFFRIREVTQTKTGRSRGLVMLIMTGHTFYKIPTEFRQNTDMILLSDLPTSPKGTFHREIYESWVPDKLDQERLRRIRLKRIGDPRWCGYAYMIDHGEPAGFVYLPQVTTQKKRAWSLSLPSVQVNVPERRDLFVPLVGLLFLMLSVYSLAVRNFTGALFWVFFVAVIGLSWVLVKRRRG